MTQPTPSEGLPPFREYREAVASIAPSAFRDDLNSPAPESWTTTRGHRAVTVTVEYRASNIGPVATVPRSTLHDLLRLAGFTGPAPVEEVPHA